MPHHQRERNAIPSEARKAADGTTRFAIKIAYDGTDYQGFQSQAHGNTIQDEIETRLKRMVRRPLRIFGWGRTDSGVHAQGAVITVDLTHEEVTRLALARNEENDDEASISEMNSLAAKSLHSALKEFACKGGAGSISALSAAPVPSDFDARFSCLWKRYVYYISSSMQGVRSPFLNRFAWQIDRELDFEKMTIGATVLSGKHNFQWMSVSQEGEMRDPVRALVLTVETVSIGGPFQYSSGADERQTLIKICGVCDFFLYRMMRRAVGILAGVGTGRVKLDQLEECIRRHDIAAGLEVTVEGSFSGSATSTDSILPGDLLQTAPAKGLCLEHIEYDIPI